MVFLLTKKAAEETPHTEFLDRSPAFQLFGAVGARSPIGPITTAFPEFIARDSQERGQGPSRKQAQGLCGP